MQPSIVRRDFFDFSTVPEAKLAFYSLSHLLSRGTSLIFQRGWWDEISRALGWAGAKSTSVMGFRLTVMSWRYSNEDHGAKVDLLAYSTLSLRELNESLWTTRNWWLTKPVDRIKMLLVLLECTMNWLRCTRTWICESIWEICIHFVVRYIFTRTTRRPTSKDYVTHTASRKSSKQHLWTNPMINR